MEGGRLPLAVALGLAPGIAATGSGPGGEAVQRCVPSSTGTALAIGRMTCYEGLKVDGLRVRIACGPRVVVCQEPEGDFGGGDGKVVRL